MWEVTLQLGGWKPGKDYEEFVVFSSSSYEEALSSYEGITKVLELLSNFLSAFKVTSKVVINHHSKEEDFHDCEGMI